jgi:hypothetical protein
VPGPWTALHYIAPRCTALCCTALLCTALYCNTAQVYLEWPAASGPRSGGLLCLVLEARQAGFDVVQETGRRYDARMVVPLSLVAQGDLAVGQRPFRLGAGHAG